MGGLGESRSTMEVGTLNGTLGNATRLLPQITSSDQSIEGGNATKQLFLEAHNLFDLHNGRKVDLERGSSHVVPGVGRAELTARNEALLQ